MAKKVKTVLNPCGLRVKKCCASCANKYIENDGLRACPVIDEYVESGHVCKKWQMDYNTLNGSMEAASAIMGSMQQISSTMQQNMESGKNLPRATESIRQEYEKDYGTTIMLDILD